MRWLDDENISGPAIQFLRDAGFELTVVTQDGMRQRPFPPGQ